MSDEDPLGGDNPFEGMPIFGDLLGMFRSQGPVSWDAARQLAFSIASGGQPEPNVEPVERMRLEELVRVADLRISDATGLATSLTGGPVAALAVTRSEWARRTLEAYRPLYERLAESLAQARSQSEPPSSEALAELGLGGDPEAAAKWMEQLLAALSPMLMGMACGSMVGHLARRSFGQYDMPVPRAASDELVLVPANIDEFATEWDLPGDEVRLWVCLHELTHHALLGRPPVHERLDELLSEYASGFRIDHGRFEERLGDIDPSDFQSFQRAFSDPEAMLGAIRSPAQEALLPQIEALLSAVSGYVDHVMDTVGRELIGAYDRIAEAVRRRRVEAGPADRFVEHLFGIELGRPQYERGRAFVEGVAERAGEEFLVRLWRSRRDLPTPAEVDAPGLWLARIELPDDEDGPDGDEEGGGAG